MAEKEKKRKRGGTATMAMLIILSLTAIILLKMTFVLLIVGILPTIVVYIIDHSESRSLFHTVMACNLAGVIPFVGELWAQGNPTSMVGHMLSDMQRLLVMYLSAAGGWGLMYICPIVAKFIISSINQTNIQRLKQKQSRLMEEWGQDIATTHQE